MTFLNKITLFSFFAVLLSSCVSPTIKKDMVKFDEAFIPAWYYTYMDDSDNARRAILPLLHTWKRFENKYNYQLLANEDRSESFRRVGAWLEEANCAIKDDEVKRAVVHLDHARYEMMELRYLLGINDYYLDKIWDLESSMALLIDYATDDKLKLAEWEEFKEVAYDLKKAWKNVLKAPINPEFELTQAQLIRLAESKVNLNKAIEHFFEELKTADARTFAAAAEDIKPAYINFINVMGDFGAIQTFYAFAK